MVTCADIIAYLDTKYNYKKTLSDLSNNAKIKSTTLAYDFDKIKYMIYKDNCSSADALLIRNNLNIIEFKTGFASPDDSLSERIKKENLQLRIRIKAYESLHLIQTAIIDEISDGKLNDRIRTIFYAVIDTNEPLVAEDTYIDILSDAGGVREHKSLKVRICEDVMRIYRKETDDHKKLFYDEAQVLYDYEFDKCVYLFK